MQRPLPVVRSHERITYKRCKKKWYWAWRRGLVPRAAQFGALQLGTWVHAAMARWYGPGLKRNGDLAEHFLIVADSSRELARRAKAPQHMLDKADELIALGEAMLRAYQSHYGADEGLRMLATEIPLEFSFSGPGGNVFAIHRLKPDGVYLDQEDDVWLLETKTAATIKTGHLVIDDQARPYGAMAERALRNLGVIKKYQRFRGIMYNFLRKGLPDERQTNAQGKYLNKNGTVSKRQPPPLFRRVPITMTRAAKMQTLVRIQRETIEITELTQALRAKTIDPATLQITPHTSCERTCDFFAMCVSAEEGADTRLMEQRMFIRRDPYLYEEDTTDDPPGFEFG